MLAAVAPSTPDRVAPPPVIVGDGPLNATLAEELVELLAPQVHLAYQRISEETGNATGSPLALELWENLDDFTKASNRAAITGSAVTHAAAGLTWRRPTPDGGATLDDALLEELGRLGHRRWAIHERRNGRGDHEWAKPWNEIKDVQHYDIDHAPPAPHPGRRQHGTGDRPARRSCRHISGSRLSQAATVKRGCQEQMASGS